MRRRAWVRAAIALAAIAVGQLTVVAPAKAAGTWLFNGTGDCLDGSVSQGVRMMPCLANSPYQKWTMTAPGRLRNDSGVCLDGSVSQGVRVLACDPNPGLDYQLWHWGPNENLYNQHVGSHLSLDGSRSQGVRLNGTNMYSKWQKWTL